VIRTGVVLPTFRETPDDALRAADDAVTAGVDGLFCYDHIWPMGQPDRPALAPFPVLGALATRFGPRADGGDGPFVGSLWHVSVSSPTRCSSSSSWRCTSWPPGA
jgi:hypothetical protein